MKKVTARVEPRPPRTDFSPAGIPAAEPVSWRQRLQPYEIWEGAVPPAPHIYPSRTVRVLSSRLPRSMGSPTETFCGFTW